MVAEWRLVTFTVVYDRRARCPRTLEWIAPELKDAGLSLIEDRLDEPHPSRTWAGMVDDPEFERFANAWQLPDEDEEPTFGNSGQQPVTRAHTFDGMNWETGGESPIVSVTVEVRVPADVHRMRRHPLPFTYIG